MIPLLRRVLPVQSLNLYRLQCTFYSYSGQAVVGRYISVSATSYYPCYPSAGAINV